jgi:sigma-E factor negative regulatory protein RseA
MKTNNIKNEQISAFADGEIDIQQLSALMIDVRQEQHFETWNLYHQIGDVLRSDEMAQNGSKDFNATLFARLSSEPAYLLAAPLPADMSTRAVPLGSMTSNSPGRRLVRSSRMISGIAAGVAVLYFGGAYLVQGGGDGASVNRLTAWTRQAPDSASLLAKNTAVGSSPQIVVMRDPQIDAYLIAHQQFSPSLYGTAQFARAANFANESAK